MGAFLSSCPHSSRTDRLPYDITPQKIDSIQDVYTFNPEQDKCKPDPKTGQCPPGFNMNGYEHCFPNKQCPKGFENHDDHQLVALTVIVPTQLVLGQIAYNTS